MNLSHALIATVLVTTGSAATAQSSLPPVPTPAGNPTTFEKVQLGKALYWDEQLSSSRTTACATCHIPSAGGCDPRSIGGNSLHPGLDGLLGTIDDVVGSPGVPNSDLDGSYWPVDVFGIGVQVTGRKAPSVINAAYSPMLFWDGRASNTFQDPLTGATVLSDLAALESQAAGPPQSPAEMGHMGRDWSNIAARMETSKPLAMASNLDANLSAFVGNRSYPDLFETVFGTNDVTPSRILMAIAAYERTLISDRTPFDAFVVGVPNTMTPLELDGYGVFGGSGRCHSCHTPPLLTDNQFHNVGVSTIAQDPGRGGITGLAQDMGAFRTPGLRNVALHPPYFHDGNAATLMDVVEAYDRGGDVHENLSPMIHPLNLTAYEKTALVAFLEVLTDPRVVNETAPFERPTLYSESNARPQIYGQATPGAGGSAPICVAIEPPLHGTDSLTIAVHGGLPDAHGFLALSRLEDVRTFAGIELMVDISTPHALIPVRLHAVAGSASYSMVLPEDIQSIGTQFFAQWLVRDPGSPGGLSASQGMAFTIF
ncbi:MAG: hypothetical protein GY930_09415 [bacterium]|nr:hypothetical protein [bacterium]